MHCVGITELDGVEREAATRYVLGRDRVHAQELLRLRLHDERALASIEALHDCGHTVHEVVRLVHIASQANAQASVQDQGQRFGQHLLQCTVLIIVAWIGLVVCRNLAERHSLALPEEDVRAEVVDQSGPLASAGDDRGVAARAFKQCSNVVPPGLMVARPRFVAATEVAYEGSPLGSGGSVLPEVCQLVDQRVPRFPAATRDAAPPFFFGRSATSDDGLDCADVDPAAAAATRRLPERNRAPCRPPATSGPSARTVPRPAEKPHR